MAVIKISELPQVLSLGNQSEQGKSIQFDVSEWDALYPGARYEITYIRPGDTGSWPATGVTHSNGSLTWVVSRSVTLKAGQGSFVIHCYVDEDEKNTGEAWYFIGGGHEIGETPDAVAEWLAETNAAEALRETAETARETAEGLRDSAEGLRAGAEISRNTAEGLRLSDETARGEAEGLRDSAETARKEAEVLRVAADAARMGFVPKGPYIPTNENKYGEWYTHEGGSYGYIWPEPSTGVSLTDTSHWQQIASMGGQDLVDAAVAARDAAQGYKDAAAASAAQLAAGLGSPVGPPYANLAALNAANPDHGYNYLTLDDGHWAYYDTGTSAFVDSGHVWQAASIAIDIEKHDNFIDLLLNAATPKYGNTLTGTQTVGKGKVVVNNVMADATYSSAWGYVAFDVSGYLGSTLYLEQVFSFNPEVLSYVIADSNSTVLDYAAQGGITERFVYIPNTASVLYVNYYVSYSYTVREVESLYDRDLYNYNIWDKDAVPNKNILNIVKELEVYDASESVDYSLAVLDFNKSNGSIQISIYSVSGSTFIEEVCALRVTSGYTFTDEPVWLTLAEVRSSGITARVFVDMTEYASTNNTGMGFSQTGISKVCMRDTYTYTYEPLPDFWRDGIVSGSTNYKALDTVLDLKLYGADLDTTYTLGVYKYTKSTGLIQIRVYEYINSAFGAIVCEVDVASGFTFIDGLQPINLVEYGGSGITGTILVDFSQYADLNLTGLTYQYGGLSSRCIYSTFHTADLSMVMPSAVLVSGDLELMCYPEQMSINPRLFNRSETVFWCTYSTAGYSGHYDKLLLNINPYIGGNLTITMKCANVAGDGSLSGQMTKAITVNSFSTPTGKTKSVLFIGDSYIDYPWLTSQSSGTKVGKGIMSQISALATADGNTINCVGSHLSYTDTADGSKVYYSEAYGGWSETQFIGSAAYLYEGQNINSPFYINSTPFNYSQYITDLGTTPDIVVFFLGMNGGNGSGINTMVTAILAAAPSTKIVVCTVPPYYRNMNALDIYTGEKVRALQNDGIITYFDNMVEDGIAVCPIHATFSRDYHFITEDAIPLTKYGSGTISAVTNHHPNEDGVKTIAENIYNYLLYWMQ